MNKKLALWNTIKDIGKLFGFIFGILSVSAILVAIAICATKFIGDWFGMFLLAVLVILTISVTYGIDRYLYWRNLED